MKEMETRTVVIGSGCAGLNAADWLYDLGERDFILLTEDMNSGTSRNTGSDKQTYYKLSLAGDEPDSVGELAASLRHGDVNGDTALCEAANSVKCFYKLVLLGVPFPCNAYGEYAGYQTDHDTRRRATSAGPLTSRYMTEALERSVRVKGIRVVDQAVAFRILTDGEGVAGLDCWLMEERDWLRIRCAHVVLCTGGPAQIYRDSVYPESQHGMSGLAFAAGARGANLNQWQYGLASVAFRWNVSGSYQQVIPRYVSVDAEGREREFLTEALGLAEAVNMTFLKGYQWPFDENKTEGSSRVDILTKRETDLGRRVYMDFRANPTGFSPDLLSPEASGYLTSSGALQGTPIERLEAMNPQAIELYQSHGIDLWTEPLEVRVCAQHHNGGIAVDADWQTCVPGLYVCGEAAGTFGKARPGGSALNSTQVGSMRAAEHIARKSSRKLKDIQAAFCAPDVPAGDVRELMREIQSEMSRVAAFQRDAEGMARLLARDEALLRETMPADLTDPDLQERLMLKDALMTQREVLSAMLYASRCPGEGVLCTERGVSGYAAPRAAAGRDLWFETVWRQYRSGNHGK